MSKLSATCTLALCLLFAMTDLEAFGEGYVHGIEFSSIGGFDFWRVNIATGEFESVANFNHGFSNSSGLIDSKNDVYCMFASAPGGYNLRTYDLETGQLKNDFPDKLPQFWIAHFNPADGLIYAMSRDFDTDEMSLFSVNAADGSSHLLGTSVLNWVGNNCRTFLDYINHHLYIRTIHNHYAVINLTDGQLVEHSTLAESVTGPVYEAESNSIIGVRVNDNGQSDLVQVSIDSRKLVVLKKNLATSVQGGTCSAAFDPVGRHYMFLGAEGVLQIFDINGELLHNVPNSTPGARIQLQPYNPFYGTQDFAIIRGSVQGDLAKDCLPGEKDAKLTRHPVLVQPINRLAYTQPDGSFTLRLPEGNYTIDVTPNELWNNSCAQNPSKFVVNDRHDQIDGLDFQLEPLELVRDLEVSISSSRPFVGRELVYFIQYKNSGTVPFSGTLVFEHDPVVGDLEASTEPTSSSANRVEWDLRGIPVGAIKTIRILMRVPAEEELRGTQICATTYVEDAPEVSELLRQHNRAETCTEIAAPLDPNDIKVHPHGLGESGRIDGDVATLTYTIRFQNIGNAPAHDVVILDTLDSDLDINTIKFGASSHDYSVNLYNGNIIEFRFEEIHLPGKEQNEPQSHGLVKFRIDLNKSLPVDTEIINSAAIYFDFNKPVITNTVVNTIGEAVTGIEELHDDEIVELRPLGNNRFVLLRTDQQAARLTLYSLLGVALQTRDLHKESQLVIDLRDQPSGRYFLQLKSGTSTIVKPMMVTH